MARYRILIMLVLMCGVHMAVGQTPAAEGCTIGVASARATADARPLLWKIRDNSNLPNNSVCFDTSFLYRFVGVTNSGDSDVWMGVNERGFAIVNSTSLDLPGGTAGLSNGQLMRYALGICSSVRDFERLLDSTNSCGRRTQANFGVLDATGAAVMFEAGGYTYHKFDANDPRQSPTGWVLRTNFSLTGGGQTGIERYRRSQRQLTEFRDGDSLNSRSLLRYHARDFSDYAGNPYPTPFRYLWSPATPLGYLYSGHSVCRQNSISAAVIAGVKPDELPTLATMWTIPGYPATGIAVPFWPVGVPPDDARGDSTSPLHDIATRIRSLLFDLPGATHFFDTYKLRDETGNGLWCRTYPAEDSIRFAAEVSLNRWRRQPPSVHEMLEAENRFAAYARARLEHAYSVLRRRTAFAVANSTPFHDVDGTILQNGSIVHLVYAGPDGTIDPPHMEPGSPARGLPSGDDLLIGVSHVIGENVTRGGLFRFQCVSWPDHPTGLPTEGDHVYVRVFNSNSLATASRYGNAQIHHVSAGDDMMYIPLIEKGQTSLSLEQFADNPSSLRFSLQPNFPNPFNASTIIEFDLPSETTQGDIIDLTVFNSLGQQVRTLHSGLSSPGRHVVAWDGTNDHGQPQATGTYLVRLTIRSQILVQRMLLLK